MSFVRFLRPLFLGLICLLLASASAYAQLQVFASFEDPQEIAALRGSEGVLFAVSKRFPAWAGNSLELIFPEAGGSLHYSRIPSDWRRQESLLLFIWSSQNGEIELVLKDSMEAQFTKSFPLRRGVNHLQLRLAEARNVDLRQMRSLGLESDRSGSVYLDYFALDRFHPVLEERGRWDINYSMKVETPHFPWGRPLAGGPIKAYAIADVADGRGIVELAQRLELDFKATTIGRSPGINKWGFGDFYEQRSGGGEFWSDAYSLAHTYVADDLLNGPNFDVILWPGLHPWESYPAEVRDAVRKRVEAGAGLVMFSPLSQAADGGELAQLSALIPAPAAPQSNLDRAVWKTTSDHYITRGVPLQAFPWGRIGVVRSRAAGDVLLETTQGTPVLAVRNTGRGRVVCFGYDEKGMIPEIENVFETGLHYPYHEYLWSLVARAVVWAAGREPKAGIEAVNRIGGEIQVALRWDQSNQGPSLAGSLRDGFGELEQDFSVPANRATVALHLPELLRGGRHLLDLRLVAGGRVYDWAALAFESSSKVTIHSLRPESDRIKRGQQVSVRLRLGTREKTSCTVTARLLDNYGRLVDEKRFETHVEGEKEEVVSFKSEDVLTHLAKIDCDVAVGAARSDRQIAEVFVLQPRQWDDYDIVMYRFGPDPIPGIWPTIDRQLRRLNVTTLSSYSLSHSKHANYDIQAQTRISGQESPDGPRRDYYSKMKKKYAETHDKKVLVREYCLNDPAYRELIGKQLKQLTEPWVPFSPLSYYVYEEPSLTCYEDDLDLCFSTHCMKALRQWLKERYGTLGALNEKWGSSFGFWDEVVPDDTYEAQARGNYVSWADHRTFMEKSYAECFEFVLAELRKIDPEGILLNSGTQESGAHNGCDYSRINQFTRHLNAYSGGNQLDFHRCFNADLKISGGAGYGILGKDVFYSFYSNLFQGSNGGAYIFWQYSTLDPDLTMSRSGQDMEEGFRELRGQGIGKLVGLGTPDSHGIAIHYSYPSIHGSWIVDGTIEEQVVYQPSSATLRGFNANRDGWVKILRDAGLQFDFISYSDVEKGALISKGYKMLILPMSVALSNQEVEAIRDFVSRGGTVIADALAGIMDERCAFRQPRALADLFGIAPARLTREAVVAMNGEPDLRAEGARALLEEQGRPMLLHHSYGSGRVFLLNYFLHRYPEDKLEGRNGPALEKLKRVLTMAEMRPKVRLTSMTGEAVPGCESYLFNNGSTQLLGLVPDKQKPSQKVRITFDRAGALYDVRRKRYLGSASTFETEIEPAVPRLFALVKKPITGLQLRAPSGVSRGEVVTIDFRVRGPDELRSVARVRVTDPQGREARFYGGNRDIVDGAGSIRFRTALNDAAGVWTVSVTEVISGTTGRAQIRVQ